MLVRLLGPLDVFAEGVSRPVTGARRRALLAVLALRAGHVVSVERLAEIVWGGAVTANTLQRHISHLRGVLPDPSAVVAHPPGYVLTADTDAAEAERLIEQANRTGDPFATAAMLRAALQLWRDRALVDVDGSTWLEAESDRLEELRGTASRALLQARIDLGEHAEVLPDLQALAVERPFDEVLQHQLMLALYRSGRQSEALAAYRQVRANLTDQLGIDPGQPLRELESQILRQDRALNWSDSPSQRIVPAQLPPAVPGFVGRASTLDRLDHLLLGEQAVVILSGTPGVGKTALAVHWAHRAADRFPDGQVYADLRGFDPSSPPADSTEVLHGLLESFGAQVPADPAMRESRWRSLLAGRRVLLVLDNAHDAAQVRPLLPGTPGCAVLVTGRLSLTALVATHNARSVPVELLPPDEARQLLIARLGADRVAAEPAAVDAIIDRCARLPLALAVVAARAVTRPARPLSGLAAELGDDTRMLDVLHAGDPTTDVRAVFSWSYRALSDPAARLYRLLGCHPGPDITRMAAASLAGLPAESTGASLTELCDAYLLREEPSGRYAQHDLMRAHAAELAAAAPEPAAVHRLLDHYLRTAAAAAQALITHRDPGGLPPPAPAVRPEPIADHDSALAWFTAERHVLLAVQTLAHTEGFDTHAWQLGWATSTFLNWRGHWTDRTRVWRTALASALRLGDSRAEAICNRGIAWCFMRLGRLTDAETHLRRARELFHHRADSIGEADTVIDLGRLFTDAHDLPAAADYVSQALRLYEMCGHTAGQAFAWGNTGWIQTLQGDHTNAITSSRRAIGLYQRAGNREGVASSWHSIGHAHHCLGEYREAVRSYRRARELFNALGDLFSEASALSELGEALIAAGDPDAAAEARRSAALLLEGLRT
ncbi:DNA-binding SARP family transcriptional activator [Allocatelliglobosispora scoriae]|uniref:DNA-binding SARP family transcriptional activator n=1 Tax=Allocatelliglobosispora scoriae TaxID=643052 RepID=A0A841BI90_9ACTN|nr:BTAD domain-containing putative transcriptional regulator [Allocatelliglobosispora scoriae]MBB5868837.1 DNA-binding SARP family transcriptional activator [Allocatelliglobosispora scoriae]